MHRLGHASPAAALVYQHAVAHRDAEIARALDALGSGGEVVPIRSAAGRSRQQSAIR
jgi:hypothetical protein